MQDLEQLKEHQEYKLTKLMIKGVIRQVASEQMNLNRFVDIDEDSNTMSFLKIGLKGQQEDYIRFVVFHYPSTNNIDVSYALYEKRKRVNYRELNQVDVNNLYNLLMQVINEVIPCQQQ